MIFFIHSLYVVITAENYYTKRAYHHKEILKQIKFSMLKPLHDILSACLNTDNWRMTLIKEWPTIFGPFSNRVNIESISDNTIVLGVNDSCLMQELYLLSPLILHTIQKSLGNDTIKQVRFKRTEVKTFQQHKRPMPVIKTETPVTLTAAESHALRGIQDPQLQEALRIYCIRCHRARCL